MAAAAVVAAVAAGGGEEEQDGDGVGERAGRGEDAWKKERETLWNVESEKRTILKQRIEFKDRL